MFEHEPIISYLVFLLKYQLTFGETINRLVGFIFIFNFLYAF